MADCGGSHKRVREDLRNGRRPSHPPVLEDSVVDRGCRERASTTDFLGEQDVSFEQATCIARAMLETAACERGVHPKEQAVITEFYLACCERAGRAPEDLGANPFDLTEARILLPTAPLREALVRCCYVVACADGHCSPLEMSFLERL